MQKFDFTSVLRYQRQTIQAPTANRAIRYTITPQLNNTFFDHKN